jgi:hypothetical protein
LRLWTHLEEQVHLLTVYCQRFDDGDEVMVKPMATALRVLLHSNPNPKSSSRALLDHLGLRSGRWWDIAGPLGNSSHPNHCALVAYQLANVGGDIQVTCLPKFTALHDHKKRIAFDEWWTRPVARNSLSREAFSRMDIVRGVADTDGGAHVDAAVEDRYARFRSGEFLSFRAASGAPGSGAVFLKDSADISGELIMGAHIAAVRTIAHETLQTLNCHAPRSFRHPFRHPEGITHE